MESLYIRGTNKGEILVILGDPVKFFGRELKKGDLLEYLPPFAALFPLSRKNIFLPNIQTETGIWVNIYLEHYASHIFALMTDNTKNALELKKKSQERNQEYLNNPKSNDI